MVVEEKDRKEEEEQEIRGEEKSGKEQNYVTIQCNYDGRESKSQR